MGKKEEREGNGFFACCLLSSLSPRHRGHTDIEFPINLRRRIRQHNGEISSGVWRTKRKRPWETILCIYGFPSNVWALQFEWAWQHPRESLAVRKAASTFKSLSGVANKIKLAYTVLTLPSWQNLKLTVNFFSTKYQKHAAACPKLPDQMKAQVCPMDDLPCYQDGWDLNDEESELGFCDGENDEALLQRVDVRDETDDLPSYPSQEKNNGCGFEHTKESLGEEDFSSDDNMPWQCSRNTASFPSSTTPVKDITVKWKQRSFKTPKCFRKANLGWLDPQPSPNAVANTTFANEFAACNEENVAAIPSPIDLLTPEPSPNAVAKTTFASEFAACNEENVAAIPSPMDLLTPETSAPEMISILSECVVRFCTKGSTICPKIIDLTYSPIVIQL